MREKIEETIIKAGLSVDEFIIGYGAKSPKSLINYNPDKSEYLGDTRKKYSVQLILSPLEYHQFAFEHRRFATSVPMT